MIRCHTIKSGFILEEYNINNVTGTKITIISNNDLKGVIPRTLVEMVAGKAPYNWTLKLY